MNYSIFNLLSSIQYLKQFIYGAPGEIRTRDPLIKSQVLLPAELQAHMVLLSGLEPASGDYKSPALTY